MTVLVNRGIPRLLSMARGGRLSNHLMIRESEAGVQLMKNNMILDREEKSATAAHGAAVAGT